MTKAARLGLDTVENVFRTQKLNMGLSHVGKIENFCVTGASKRGWTTWTIASVDKRVKCAIPVVLDCLNMKTQFVNWFKNLGAWSFALYPYWVEGLTSYIESWQFEKMMDIVDPYSYRKRLTMPLLVITATGDEFFAPDDSYFYFNDLPDSGHKYLRLLPNTEHTTRIGTLQKLSGPDSTETMRAFYLATMKGFRFPKISWTRTVDINGLAQIRLETDRPPAMINGWIADSRNYTRRDFRWAQIEPEKVKWPTDNDDNKQEPSEDDIKFQPIKWNKIIAETESKNSFVISVPAAVEGFRALMAEISFVGADSRSLLTFTTEVMITPDSRPFEMCEGDCISHLV